MAYTHGEILLAVATLAREMGVFNVSRFDYDDRDNYLVPSEDGRPLRLRGKDVWEMAAKIKEQRK